MIIGFLAYGRDLHNIYGYGNIYKLIVCRIVIMSSVNIETSK